MTDAPPKRRGRPRGSRNKPKALFDPPLPAERSFETGMGQLPGWLDSQLAGEPLASVVLETTTIPVILSREARVWDGDPEEQRVDWPVGWRLPLRDEMIHLRNDFGGIVSTIDFDLERKIAVIHLR